MTLRPFFSYYGSKWNLAPKYPAPLHDTIIEPFAGSAGYALRYPDRKVILVERDPVVAGIWRWLIGATEAEIDALPRPQQGERLSDYDVPQAARWLMGFWVNKATVTPCDTVTKFGATSRATGRNLCDLYIERAISQVGSIRHWRVIEGDYTDSPDDLATWFVDPPYMEMGYKYTFGSKSIDYAALGEWCWDRRGQVIACENYGAWWLPFEHLSAHVGIAKGGARKASREAVWHSAAVSSAVAAA